MNFQGFSRLMISCPNNKGAVSISPTQARLDAGEAMEFLEGGKGRDIRVEWDQAFTGVL
jgi:hypothetical protein